MIVRLRHDLWTPIALLTVIGCAARFATLGLQSFWGDELWTVWLLRQDFRRMLTTIPHTESTPYLYYILAWIWARVFGTSEAGLRSLSAVFGTILILVAAMIGRELGGRRAAVGAAALVALNPFLYWYSQEGRAYALLALASAASFLFFLRVERGRARSDYMWWTVASVVALNTHYFGAFLVVPEAVWLLTRREGRRYAVASAAFVFVTIAALVPLAVRQHHERLAEWISRLPLLPRLRAVPREFLVGGALQHRQLLAAAAAACVAYALSLYLRPLLVSRNADSSRRAASFVVAAAALVIPAALSVAGFDYLDSHNVIAALVPALAIVAAGLAATRLGLAAVTALSLIFAVAVLTVEANPIDQRADWRGLARAINARPLPSAPSDRSPLHAERARIVVAHFNPAFLFQPYLPHTKLLPPTGSRVTELDIVDVGQPEFLPQRPRILPAPPPGFRVVETRETTKFTLLRYVAARPTLILPTEAKRLAIVPKSTALLVPVRRRHAGS